MALMVAENIPTGRQVTRIINQLRQQIEIPGRTFSL